MLPICQQIIIKKESVSAVWICEADKKLAANAAINDPIRIACLSLRKTHIFSKNRPRFDVSPPRIFDYWNFKRKYEVLGERF